MKYLILLLLLSGCSTLVPTSPKFPDAPPIGLEGCSSLDTVSDNVKLSELTGTVVKNYGLYHECSIKVETWNSWYEQQRKIYQGISK